MPGIQMQFYLFINFTVFIFSVLMGANIVVFRTVSQIFSLNIPERMIPTISWNG